MKDNKNSRLILVSNRLPLKVTRHEGETVFVESDGGLVSSIKSYFERHNDQRFVEKYWVGAADFKETAWKKFNAQNEASSTYRIKPIFIDDKTFGKYYNGFSNATIWPLFHYFPSFAEYDEAAFQSYETVNRIFHDHLIGIIKPGDTIWIHDYHLFLLPQMIRESVPGVTIGFFLHIPFPSYEIFRLLHDNWKSKIVHGLLGSDLIGFHTSEYLQHFLQTVRMIAGFDHRYREIYLGERVVKADVFPLGIDFEKFHDTSENDSIAGHCRAIEERFRGLKIIFSVDRLDYTKGVTHRLSGYERFLEAFPEWRGKVVLLMVVVPSRAIVSKYNERRKMIEEQVGRINGKYSTTEWQPIIYRYNNLSFEELAGHYQGADVALVTPLRDGMNLVAKEYIASRVNGDGVLILSELAGAASELGEALLVNPTDKEAVANKINAALLMPAEAQKERMSVMQQRLKKANVVVWVSKYFQALDLIKKQQGSSQTQVVDDIVAYEINVAFQQADKRLLFLDYDGTLAPIVLHPEHAQPGKNLLDLLESLAEIDKTELVIISGRSSQTLEKWLGHLNVHLVAEHGASIRLRGGIWQHSSDIDRSWKPTIRSTFELFVNRSPGAFIEEKDHTIAWHYRGVENQIGFARSRELLDNLYHLIRNTHLNILDGHKVIEVRAPGIDKGMATSKIMAMIPADFVMAMGDDRTDEDIFKILDRRGITIKVGPGITGAGYRLQDQDQAVKFLQALELTQSVLK